MPQQFVMFPITTRLQLPVAASQNVFIMPNQPLSAVFLTVDMQLTSANTNDDLQAFLARISLISFMWKGTSIWSLRGDDLYRLTRVLGVWHCRFEATGQNTNARRIMVLCIPFGRKLWDANECFPGVDKGTTQLQVNYAGDGGGYNTCKITVEPLQLLGAQPTQFIRSITFSDTPAAVGNKDYDLPRLYPLAGIGITTTGSEPASALDDIENYKILMNYQDYDYSIIQADLARAMQWFKKPPAFDDTMFIANAATLAAYSQNQSTSTPWLLGDLTRNFHYLNFDPSNDGNWLLDASKATDLKLRANFNTAAAMRYFPVEIWPASAIPKGGS